MRISDWIIKRAEAVQKEKNVPTEFAMIFALMNHLDNQQEALDQNWAYPIDESSPQSR